MLMQTRSKLFFAAGLTLGLLFGVGMLVGALTTRWTASGAALQFPETVLRATASHGTDTMAMATGPVGDLAEGLFVLDFITGDLQCFVLYPRTGVFGGQFKVNVVADLGIQQGKKPNYLMVTGGANFTRGAGNVRPANSVVYVGDANSGQFAAYSIPWSTALEKANRPQADRLVLLGTGKARNLEIRQP